jgi:hypothetical protein
MFAKHRLRIINVFLHCKHTMKMGLEYCWWEVYLVEAEKTQRWARGRGREEIEIESSQAV